ncbi:hypothetical protein [Lacinutrix jangbogonensis]|uniref:hypothetical protein n=1 Tax=Lacinutrix jangbogonensis TaxID=1469557 RepID=UPI00053EA05E|nr:hypothetical protein [Lacinutrix jangbogonensis]
MPRPTWFVFTAITLFLLVITLDVFEFDLISSTLELALVPVVTVLYLLLVKNRSKCLSIFFILYSITDIINILDFNAISDWAYFVCNTLYIGAYFFLMLYIIKSLSFKLVFKNFLLDFVVLILIDLYMVYVLISMIKPLDFESNQLVSMQLIELVYNLIIIIVLSLSFLNFVQNAVKKYFLLFVSCVLITFSELMLIGYYYIVEDIRISYASSFLFICGIIMLLFHTFIVDKVKTEHIVSPISPKT